MILVPTVIARVTVAYLDHLCSLFLHDNVSILSIRVLKLSRDLSYDYDYVSTFKLTIVYLEICMSRVYTVNLFCFWSFLRFCFAGVSFGVWQKVNMDTVRIFL